MKIKKLLTALFVICLCLTGCENNGISQKYDAPVAERDKLKEKYNELRGGYDELEEKYDILEKRYDELFAPYRPQRTLNANNEIEEFGTETEDSSKIAIQYYSSGHYKVGTDIEPEEYVLLAEGDKNAFLV